MNRCVLRAALNKGEDSERRSVWGKLLQTTHSLLCYFQSFLPWGLWRRPWRGSSPPTLQRSASVRPSTPPSRALKQARSRVFQPALGPWLSLAVEVLRTQWIRSAPLRARSLSEGPNADIYACFVHSQNSFPWTNLYFPVHSPKFFFFSISSLYFSIPFDYDFPPPYPAPSPPPPLPPWVLELLRSSVWHSIHPDQLYIWSDQHAHTPWVAVEADTIPHNSPRPTLCMSPPPPLSPPPNIHTLHG